MAEEKIMRIVDKIVRDKISLSKPMGIENLCEKYMLNSDEALEVILRALDKGFVRMDELDSFTQSAVEFKLKNRG